MASVSLTRYKLIANKVIDKDFRDRICPLQMERLGLKEGVRLSEGMRSGRVLVVKYFVPF